MVQAVATNQQEPTSADNPRNEQEAYTLAIKISREVIRQAKQGNKTCLRIFSDVLRMER